MHLSTWASALLVVVLVVHVDVVGSRGGSGGGGRGGGGGGRSGGSRGSSASRGTSSNRGNSASSGSSGTSYSSSNRGNIGGGTSTFSKGSGIGSIVRGSTFKSAIAGAAAGYLTYRAGKAIIRSASMGMMWNNRPYYWGSNYYQQRSGYEMCSMPMGSDNAFGDVYFEGGVERPKQIVWSCRSYSEYCCGYECCPSNRGGGFFGGGALIFVIILLMLLCCGGFLLYKFFRRSLDCILGSNDNRNGNGGANVDNSNVPFNPPAPVYQQPNFGQSYPTQPYVNQAYPLQPQYPQQPPAYGFKPY